MYMYQPFNRFCQVYYSNFKIDFFYSSAEDFSVSLRAEYYNDSKLNLYIILH